MINFKSITGDDKDTFLTLSQEFYSSSAVLHPISMDFHQNTFAELMRSRDYLECFIIEYDKKVAGYGLLNKMFQHEAGGITIWFEELYIREEFRSLGIGRAFFKFVMDKFPASRYRLEVEHDNKRAISLYKSLGFDFLEYQQMIVEG